MERAGKPRSIIVAIGILLLACSPFAFALDPSLDVNQYAHTAWKLSEGFSKGIIWSIAQTPDGYLWLGTEFGLLRFDGVRTVSWQPPTGERLPSSYIKNVRVTRDGTLWIGTSSGLVSWKDGKLTHYPAFDGLIIEALLEDREGTIWVVAGWALSEARLCSIHGEKTHCFGEDGSAGSKVTAIYEDSQGTLWAGGMKGVWRWQPGPPMLYAMAGPEQRTYALTESDDGGILIARRSGITKLRNGKFEPYPLPAGLHFQPNRFLRDRDGGLWVGAVVDQGLLHIHQGKMDRFTPADGVFGDLSGDNVRSFFEDREGNIWVATGNGLDRFREFAVPTFSVPQGLSSRGISSVLAGKDGSVWLGASDGLNRWNKELVTIYRNPSARSGVAVGQLTPGQLAQPGSTIREIDVSGLPEGEVTSLFEDDQGNLWVSTVSGLAILKGHRFYAEAGVSPGNMVSIAGDRADNVWISHDDGLLHLFHERLVERIPWSNFGRKQPARALLHDAAQGGLWLGFREGGVAFYKDGQLLASYAGAQGLAEGIVQSFYSDGKGALWVAAEGGLSRIKGGGVVTLTSRNGLPCDNVHWMMEDDAGSVWLYTACGIVRIARPELDGWVSHPNATIQVSVFDSLEGVRNHPVISGYGPIVAKAIDGRLWFSSSEGVSLIDPHSLHENKLPPLVHIEQVTADDKPFDATNGMRLTPRNHYLVIDYTALSMVAPEKVRFRFKLEGLDTDWREVGNVRQVQYTNLPPKHYRFRVLACNNSGVWNETGDTLEFVIPPMWYQTNWFFAVCAAAFLALLWAAYQVRMRQMSARFNMRLEERVSERTRIARELHDTLLQSFHGLLVQLQSVLQLLPQRPLDARQRLEGTIDDAAAAITEARDAVQGLRSSTITTNELTRTLKTLGEELSHNEANPTSPRFGVEVFGTPRELHPIIRDEVYRVASEALRNAFLHAHAQQIEVELRYEDGELLVAIRDDGKGIDPQVLAGKAGHFGLPGMHERAKLVGGRLEVWSELNQGTEIELTIPAANAYAKLMHRTIWLRRLSRIGRDKEMKIEP